MVRELWPQLQRKIPGLFEAVEKIEPSLQHGDFWYGNTAENEEGQPRSNEDIPVEVIEHYVQ